MFIFIKFNYRKYYFKLIIQFIIIKYFPLILLIKLFSILSISFTMVIYFIILPIYFIMAIYFIILLIYFIMVIYFIILHRLFAFINIWYLFLLYMHFTFK